MEHHIEVYFIKKLEGQAGNRSQEYLRRAMLRGKGLITFKRIGIRRYRCIFPPPVVDANTLWTTCEEIAERVNMSLGKFIIIWQVGSQKLEAEVANKEGLSDLFKPLFMTSEGLSIAEKDKIYALVALDYRQAGEKKDYTLQAFWEARLRILKTE